MVKPTKTLQGKTSKPRGRNGGRKSTLSEDNRKEQANVWLPRGLNKKLRDLVPEGVDRNALFAEWVASYLADKGDRKIPE